MTEWYDDDFEDVFCDVCGTELPPEQVRMDVDLTGQTVLVCNSCAREQDLADAQADDEKLED